MVAILMVLIALVGSARLLSRVLGRRLQEMDYDGSRSSSAGTGSAQLNTGVGLANISAN